MSTTVERLELLLTSNAKDAIAGIRATQAAAVDLDGATGGAQKRMGFLSAAAQTAGTHIRDNIGMYSVAAVGALTGAAVASLREFTRLADTVRDFQRSTGAGAESASRLVAVFDDLEISQETASRAFFKLSREIGTGDSNLEQWGVKVARTKEGNVDLEETMLRVAAAYERTSDQGQRAALIQEAFGRGGKDLIPILEKGREGIQRLFENVPEGQILSQTEIDNAREYQLAMDDLADSLQEIKVAAGSAIAPAVASIGSGLAGAIRTSNEATQSIGGLSTVIGYASTAFNPLYWGSNAASGAMSLLKGNVGDAASSFAHAIPGVGSLADKFGLGSQKSNEFAGSQKRLSEAQAEVARLAADSTTKHSELTAAKRELTSAENDYEGVVRRVSAAIGDQTQKTIDNQIAAAQYTNAQLGLTGAQLNVEAATARYNQTLAENGADALETRQAAQNLEQQYLSLGQATFDAAIQSGKSQEEAAAAQVAALTWVAGTMEPGSPLRNFLEDYINRLQGIPRTVATTLALKQAVQGFMNPGVDANGNPVLETFAAGGVVPGAPGARRIIEAHGGEAIFNEPQLRALANAGMSIGGGPGASAAGGGTVMFVIDGQVLGRASLDAINEAAKVGGVIRAEAIIS